MGLRSVYRVVRPAGSPAFVDGLRAWTRRSGRTEGHRRSRTIAGMSRRRPKRPKARRLCPKTHPVFVSGRAANECLHVFGNFRSFFLLEKVSRVLDHNVGLVGGRGEEITKEGAGLTENGVLRGEEDEGRF